MPSPSGATRLTLRYAVALSLIALLLGSSQVLVQVLLSVQQTDARVINVAGRQRMLSQRIHSHLLAARGIGSDEAIGARMATLSGDLDLWRRSHRGLRAGSSELGLPGQNSPRVEALFEEMEPHYVPISAAAGEAVEAAGSGMTSADLADRTAIVSAHETAFLVTMDSIVNAFEDEAAVRVQNLRQAELALMALAFVLLVLEALFIFRPAVRRIRVTMEELRQAKESFERLSFRDGLTGVANRRRFESALEREWRRAKRHSKKLSLIMIDVDNFKGHNDLLGHECGDVCLVQIAEALAGCTRRPTDLVARFGGDEFVALLPDTGIPGATQVAEAMIEAVDALGIEHGSAEGVTPIRVSTGVASAIPDETFSKASDLWVAADRELYREKKERKSRPPSRPPSARATSSNPPHAR